MDEHTLDGIFTKKVLPTLKHLTPQTKPKGYVLGGQPGAGKSQLLRQAALEHQGNLAILNADEFRPLHPQFKAIEQEHGLEAANHTAPFAAAMVQKALHYCIEKHLNIAIEGTFRTAETPMVTLKALQNEGYQTEVLIGTCPKEVSWSSTLNRYADMQQDGLSPRFTPKAAHDIVVSHLGDNAQQVLNSGLVGRMRVYSREKLLFDSHENPVGVKTVISNELHRALSPAEQQAVLLSYKRMQAIERSEKSK